MNDKILTLGEVLLRLTAPLGNRMVESESFLANYGGGEANVAISLAHLGHEPIYLTRMPQDEMGEGAIRFLKYHDVDTSFIVRDEHSLGLYFLENGCGVRPSEVIYHRAHSSASHMDPSDFDWDKVFAHVGWLHLSGITLALSPSCRATALKALEEARKRHLKISFDFNYRSKLMSLEEAKEVYPRIVPYVNVVFASPFDFTTIMGLSPRKDDDSLFTEALKKYHLDYIFGKVRRIISAREQEMRAFVYSGKGKDETPNRSFEIYDRIGAGDAYAAGVIHSLLKDYDDQKQAIDFGIANSILKQTIFGDASTFSEKELREYLSNLGHEEVKR